MVFSLENRYVRNCTEQRRMMKMKQRMQIWAFKQHVIYTRYKHTPQYNKKSQAPRRNLNLVARSSKAIEKQVVTQKCVNLGRMKALLQGTLLGSDLHIRPLGCWDCVCNIRHKWFCVVFTSDNVSLKITVVKPICTWTCIKYFHAIIHLNYKQILQWHTCFAKEYKTIVNALETTEQRHCGKNLCT